MTTPRLDSARRHLRLARYAIGVASAIAFAGAALAARAAHPGSHTTTHTPSVAQATTDDNQSGDDSFDFGSSSVAPSQDLGAPTVRSGGS
jgi:hypothetical protein